MNSLATILVALLAASARSTPLPLENDNAREDLNASAFYVKDLPGTENIPRELLPTMHAGHIAIDQTHNGKLFFWSFDAQNTATDHQKTVSTSVLFYVPY